MLEQSDLRAEGRCFPKGDGEEQMLDGQKGKITTVYILKIDNIKLLFLLTVFPHF